MRSPGIYSTERPTACAARHSPQHRAANTACCQTHTLAQGGQPRMLSDIHPIDCTIVQRFVDWAHFQSLWPGALPVAMAGRTPRPHRAHSRYLCKLRDWAHSQSYAAVFQLYAKSCWAHSRRRLMQLPAVHRGWAHFQAFGGNVNAFNASTTSQGST